MLDRDVFGVQMNQATNHAFEPLVRIFAREIAVAGVEVDPDGRVLDELVDAVEACGRLAVLLVALDPIAMPRGSETLAASINV